MRNTDVEKFIAQLRIHNWSDAAKLLGSLITNGGGAGGGGYAIGDYRLFDMAQEVFTDTLDCVWVKCSGVLFERADYPDYTGGISESIPIIPQMSSGNSPAPWVVTQAASSGGAGWCACDRNPETYWSAQGANWIEVLFDKAYDICRVFADWQNSNPTTATFYNSEGESFAIDFPTPGDLVVAQTGIVKFRLSLNQYSNAWLALPTLQLYQDNFMLAKTPVVADMDGKSFYVRVK